MSIILWIADKTINGYYKKMGAIQCNSLVAFLRRLTIKSQ